MGRMLIIRNFVDGCRRTSLCEGRNNLTKCPSCGVGFQKRNDWDDLAGHFVAGAGRSDAGHVMWLNRNITKNKSDRKTLAKLLAGFFDLGGKSLESWGKGRFIEKFYGGKLRPIQLTLV